MIDVTESDAEGPRCDFCGRAQENAERLVSGPAVHICASCVRDAVGMLEGEVATEEEPEEPAPKDYRAAYLLIDGLPAPLKGLLDQVHPTKHRTDLLEALAGDIAFYRRTKSDSIPEAMPWALQAHLQAALRAFHRHN